MIKIIKLICFFLLFSSAIVFSVQARGKPGIYSLDGVRYSVFGAQNAQFRNNELLYFHSVFTESVSQLYARYNVKMPSRFRVTLALRSKIFKQLTGINWFVAGLFDPVEDGFYFQNPVSLRRRGILTRVVRHEITHQVIFRARVNSGKSGSRKDLFWLEESFCEALYPVEKGNIPAIAKTMKKFGSYNRFRKYLSKNLASSNRIVKKRAYGIAQTWGSFLINRLGERPVFEVLIGGKSPGIIKKEFVSFKKKYN
ncbi:MAG: hypothetical protein GY754_10975 [bacterium]|nr:hypothetical protein [bacterium]